jgi:hypothetical protein
MLLEVAPQSSFVYRDLHAFCFQSAENLSPPRARLSSISRAWLCASERRRNAESDTTANEKRDFYGCAMSDYIEGRNFFFCRFALTYNAIEIERDERLLMDVYGHFTDGARDLELISA